MAKKDMKNEEVKLDQSKSGFTLIGEVKLTDNTFPPESESNATKFISRRFNLGVKVDEGRVSYAEMFGGFHGNNPRDINVFTKGENGEKGKRMEVSWEDRLSLDDTLMGTIADFSLITVAIERDANGKPFYNKFLSAYDAIQYLEAHLKDGEKVKVKGKLTPNYYNGNTTMRKEITYIGLAKEDEVPCAKGFISVLVDENSVGKSRVKQDDELDINAFFIAYASKINGVEVKKNIPYPMTLVLPLQSSVEDKLVRGKVKRILEILKVKSKTMTEVKFDIVFEEGVMVRQASVDDLDKDSRQLVEDGIISLEDAIGKISVSGGRLNRVVVTAPSVKRIEKDDKYTLAVDFEPEKYKAEDVAFDFDNVAKKEEEKEEELNSDELFTSDDNESTDVSSLLSDLGIDL